MAAIRRGRDGDQSIIDCIEFMVANETTIFVDRARGAGEQSAEVREILTGIWGNLAISLGPIWAEFGLNFGGFWTGWRKARAATRMPRQRASKRSSTRTPAPHREIVSEKNPQFMNFFMYAEYWRWIPVGTSSRQRCRRRCGPSVRKPTVFVDFQHH